VAVPVQGFNGIDDKVRSKDIDVVDRDGSLQRMQRWSDGNLND